MGGCFSSPSSQQQTQSHALQKWDPLSYIPPDKSREIRNSNVYYVHFIAHSVIQTGGNHWIISLQTGEHQSVQLNMSPGAFVGQEGYLGRLDIIRQPYGITRNSHKTISITPTPGHSVADFLEAIVNADNHRYEFTREGRGCTRWIRDQFILFVDTRLLPGGWEQQIEEALNTAWQLNQAVGQWPVTAGTYLRERGGGRRRGRSDRG